MMSISSPMILSAALIQQSPPNSKLSAPENNNNSNNNQNHKSNSSFLTSTPDTKSTLNSDTINALSVNTQRQISNNSSSSSSSNRDKNNTAIGAGAGDIDTDSGKSSCSPTQFDCSIDSGISGIAEVNNMQLNKRIQQCKRILIALERDKEAYRILRGKLWKIVDKKAKRIAETEEICNVCCANINVNDIKSFVTCCNCHKRICRGIKCADWIPKSAQWECQLCHTSKESLAQTSSWVAEQMSFNQQKMIYPMRARSEIFIPIGDCHDGSIIFESVSQTGANSANISAEQKIQIREYVEEIVTSLLGGSLDNINVGKLSNSENYLPAIINGRSQSVEPAATNNSNEEDNNVGNLSNISHARLRQLIETIIAETLRTPNLLNGTATSEITLDTRSNGDVITNGIAGRRHRTEHYFEPRIYQDLLATAVLNKIVDTHGNNNGRRVSESTPDLSIGGERDVNFNVENRSTTSGSSVEPRSDCSLSDNELMGNIDRIAELSPNDSPQNLNVDNSLTIGRESVLSDYIANHMVPLPDLSAAATESGSDDQASASSSTLAEGTWEDNWLFKKRDSSIKASVTGSAMLVPAPKEDIRAQIGDKAADEVSDLSEMGSETDDSSLDLIRAKIDPMNERVLNKHLIGGQNTKMVLDELVECSSINSAKESKLIETENTHIKETTEAKNLNVNQTQQPTIDKDIIVLGTTQINKPNPLTGSIAEREYNKWNNAVDMPNNPYSAEALKKRISGSQERFIDLPNISPNVEIKPIAGLQEAEVVASQKEIIVNDLENTKRYSRDYYINDGKSPSSTTKSPPKSNTTALPIKKAADVETNDDDIIINEVIPNGNATTSQIIHDSNAIHWTLSTPVRRSSSLKFIDLIRSSPNNHHFNMNIKKRSSTPTTMTLASTKLQHYEQLPKRAATSTSNYEEDDFYDDETADIRSQHSWKSAEIKRRPNSSLSSVHSSVSMSSLNSISAKKRSLSNSNVLTQFEKQLLHKDLKRNSFRAISATTKDFVLNPLFERDQFFDVKANELTLRPDSQQDDQGDSGVDSCLNGFSEIDAKNSNNSLLF